MKPRKINSNKRGVSLMEAVIAMAIIGVMIALAISASVIGMRNQRNSRYRMLAAGAAGEMYSAFSRAYFDVYGSDFLTTDERAEAFLNSYALEIAAGLDLYTFTVSVDEGHIGNSRTIVMDSASYYTAATSVDSEGNPITVSQENVVKTRYIVISDYSYEDGFTAQVKEPYRYTFTYYYVTLDFDEDDMTYTTTEQFCVTADINLNNQTCYGNITATVNGYSKSVFDEEASYAFA